MIKCSECKAGPLKGGMFVGGQGPLCNSCVVKLQTMPVCNCPDFEAFGHEPGCPFLTAVTETIASATKDSLIQVLREDYQKLEQLVRDSAETFSAIARICEHNCPKQSNAAIQLAKAMVVRLGGDFHEPSDRVVDALIAGSLLQKQAIRSDERCEVCGEVGACKCHEAMPTNERGYVQTGHHKVCKRCGLPNDNTAGSCVSCGREFESPTGGEQ